MIEAKTMRVMYQRSQVNRLSGIRANEVKCDNWESEFVDGQRVVGGGNGTYVTATPSHLILRIKIGNEEHEIWIERVFKKLLGIKRLTEKARSRISTAMPDTVQVNEQWSRRGRIYYILSENSVIDWARRVLEA